MAKIRLLIDTDILIDALKGIKASKELFRAKNVDLYCSILSRKELLLKRGLRDSERKSIFQLLSGVKILKIDEDINRKYFFLMKKYGENQDRIVDYVIAATAWAKNLPILTRNRKHFEYIKEIIFVPGYEMEETKPTKQTKSTR